MTTTMNTDPIRRPTWARVVLGGIFAVAMLVGVTPEVRADGSWSSYSGDFSGVSYSKPYGGYNGGYHGGSKSNPAPVQQNSYQGGGRSYPAYYRSGNGGFGWLNYNRGRDSTSGYQGPGGANNTPHRSDWYAKLQAQRRWDEQQFKKAQQTRGVECGLNGAPAYCYKLQGPYPTEMKIVRY